MILEAIYNGDFYPSEKVVPTSPAYIEALKTCEKLMEQLSRRLSLVEELQTQSSIAQGEESEYHFKYGFSAGLLVQQEAVEQVKKINDK